MLPAEEKNKFVLGLKPVASIFNFFYRFFGRKFLKVFYGVMGDSYPVDRITFGFPVPEFYLIAEHFNPSFGAFGGAFVRRSGLLVRSRNKDNICLLHPLFVYDSVSHF